jgi:hypothetical protein
VTAPGVTVAGSVPIKAGSVTICTAKLTKGYSHARVFRPRHPGPVIWGRDGSAFGQMVDRA